ncbi:MAG: DUF4114 domain-containing protein [Cyanobacteria bacterium P01_A01_bin.84]
MTIITVSSTADSGEKTLREAILKAKSGDTIRFNSALANKTIRLNKQLVVDKSLTIDGSDAPNLTISGERKTRILRVDYKYSDLVLRNLTFANGRAVDNNPDKSQRGGAIELVDSNNLVVENSRFINNTGERSGAIFVGYGSKAKVRNSLFDGNDGSVANDGFSAGAISTYGGGEGATVVNSNGERNVGGDASLDIRDTTFTNNKGTFGAVYTLLGELKVEDSVFKNNEGMNGGGAIFTDGANGSEKQDNLGGTTLIRNILADGNISRGDYGGALFLSGYSGDKIIVENSKIINNQAPRGGGLAVQSYRDEENPASLVIRNSTIANNKSTSQGGGLWSDAKGGVKIENSTFFGNQVTNSKGNGQIGGAIVLNNQTEAKSTITNTKFINNYADVQSGNIWVSSKNRGENLTIRNSQFAGNRSGNKKLENTVNFQVTDGGRNVVQNTNDTDEAIAGAKLVEDLQIDPVPVDSGKDLKDLGYQPPVKTVVSPQSQPISPASPPTPSNPKPDPAPKSIKNNLLRYEAEELNLNGYQVETIKGSGASGGKHISLKGTGQDKGFATGKFTGKTGKYQVKVGYYDENDGQSQAKITVGEETTSFTFDRDFPDSWVKPTSKTSRVAIKEVQLKSGDTFKIEGNSDKGEFARFDYVEFSPVKDTKPSKDVVNKGVVDLRNVDLDGNGKTDKKVSLTLDDIDTKVSNNNSGGLSGNSSRGFYQVLDTKGTVVDTLTNERIKPGEEGYETAALSQRISKLEFDTNDASLNTQVDGGILLAPYLISNGSVEEFIDKNPDNSVDKSGLNAYFPFGKANPDGQTHFKSSENSFGFENLHNGGTTDFQDLTFEVQVRRP